MNPLISPVKNSAGAWSAPGNMTAAQFTFLAKLDMDAIEQAGVDAISTYTDLWIHNVPPTSRSAWTETPCNASWDRAPSKRRLPRGTPSKDKTHEQKIGRMTTEALFCPGRNESAPAQSFSQPLK
jgi:hypothetical protein